MSIELTEKIVGIWFVDLDNESDWLGAMERTDEGYQVTYRFRYYVDDKAHDSDDKKSEDWDDNSVAQEGHISINDAAAAEDADDEDELD